MVSGSVMLIDTDHYKPALAIPEVKTHVLQGAASQVIQNSHFLHLFGDQDIYTLSQKEKEVRAKRDAKLIMAFNGTLPRSIQLRTKGDSGTLVYCPVRADGMTSPINDMIMNHGAVIQGKWSVFGIYDARPDTLVTETIPLGQSFGLDAGGYLQSAWGYAPVLRTAGRGAKMHGITPLMVFRQIGDAQWCPPAAELGALQP